ncbi:MAG TPA: DUF222 domain-containing protein [Nocardioides sp.]|nr:DUF222 domain-containing protein [Nocardioides sp.]
MSQSVVPFRPPLLRAVDEIGLLLDDVADLHPMYLTTSQKQELLVAVERQTSRLAALKSKALAAAGDVADAHGTRHAGAWLAHETRQDPSEGRRAQRLAEGLDQRWPILAEAYAAGSVSTAQSQVIGHALDDLPADLDPGLRIRAEQHLVEEADHFCPRDLKVLGRRVLEVLAPDVAEAREAKLLEREEQEAWDNASITHRRLGNGRSRAVVTLPDAAMDRWLTQLHAFTSPRREGQAPAGDCVPYPRKLAHAFTALLERIPEDWLPQHGGTATAVVVTIDQAKLAEDLATAGLTTGTAITAGEARRMACGAGILPAVLDGKSQPLDLGRAKRLFSPAQRKALAIRDRECRAEGCDIPAGWAEAHHLDPWASNGRTDLDRGVLLCSFHHHRAHDTRYDLIRMASGDLRFHRRT